MACFLLVTLCGCFLCVSTVCRRRTGAQLPTSPTLDLPKTGDKIWSGSCSLFLKLPGTDLHQKDRSNGSCFKGHWERPLLHRNVTEKTLFPSPVALPWSSHTADGKNWWAYAQHWSLREGMQALLSMDPWKLASSNVAGPHSCQRSSSSWGAEGIQIPA